MDKQFGRIAALMNMAAGLIVLVLMFATTADILNRFLRDESFAGLAEYFEILLVAFLYLSLAHTQRTGSHVEIDSVMERSPPRIRLVLETAGNVVVVLALGIFVWHTGGRAIDSVLQQEYRMGLTQVPVWPARALIPVGYLALAVQFALRAAMGVSDLVRGPDDVIAESN